MSAQKDITAGQWLVPFKGRNPSGAFNQNFLWRHGSVYVMDNHRAALWCWLQHIDPHAPHSIFHMDRHTDTLQSRLDEWRAHLPETWALSIEEYLVHSYPLKALGEERTLPLFSWDNYLSIYFDQFGGSIDHCFFAIHEDGDKPNHHAITASLWDMPSNLDYWLNPEHKPWIMNIDLDYFFWHASEEERPEIMVSDAFLNRCCDIIRQRMDDGSIAVTTICLTPDEGLTGGWESSERLMERVLTRLGIKFRLP
jgi:hypothetical protein